MNYHIAESFGNATTTHCEYSVQKHLPSNTSWWTLCSPRSRSSASRAGQSLPHTFCGNTPWASMQASVQTGKEEMMTREISGRVGNESRHNHISCAAGLSGGPEINAFPINIRVSGCQALTLTECNLKCNSYKVDRRLIGKELWCF